jgi:DNA-binding transcriptional regulator GbsR (MarR family)
MKLTPAQQRYVKHWKEMGPRLGVEPNVAQVVSLLFLVEDPLDVADLAAALEIDKRAVRKAVHEVEAWGVVELYEVEGKRSTHYTIEMDALDVVRHIVLYRKQHELDPSIKAMRKCLADVRRNPDEPPETRERIEDALDLMEIATSYYEDLHRLSSKRLRFLMTVGQNALRLFR